MSNIERYEYRHVSGTNSSERERERMKWKLGEDVPGNNKPGWWIDEREGGKISFKLHLIFPDPVIGIGYLISYEHMGRARVYLDDNKNEGMILDGQDSVIDTEREKERHVSYTSYKRLCKERDKDEREGVINQVHNNDNNNNNNTNNINNISVVFKSNISKSNSFLNNKTLLHSILPYCDTSITYNKNRFRQHQSVVIGSHTGKHTGEIEIHNLTFHLLPLINNNSIHNKFKILYIVTC
mmetsp:Transcript_39472/g.40219  ORF Transcript_39472/g.40219 Transcript_39472/m.40219 type:complete len:239 (+) Transcript_39472:2-718(+)